MRGRSDEVDSRFRGKDDMGVAVASTLQQLADLDVGEAVQVGMAISKHELSMRGPAHI